jgi:diaminopimelate epimerase
VLDKNKNTIVSTNPTFSESANTSILLGTAFTIPSTATVGLGYVRTTAVCGTSTTASQSRVYIAN